MFKNHEFRVRVAKTDPQPPTTNTEKVHIDPVMISVITKDLVTHTALAVGAVVVARTVLGSAREIAFLAAAKKFS